MVNNSHLITEEEPRGSPSTNQQRVLERPQCGAFLSDASVCFFKSAKLEQTPFHPSEPGFE